MRDYIAEVKKQIYCNATEEYRNNYITYDYTNAQIDDNKEYFEKCETEKLSPYKSLLFFQDYLDK